MLDERCRGFTPSFTSSPRGVSQLGTYVAGAGLTPSRARTVLIYLAPAIKCDLGAPAA